MLLVKLYMNSRYYDHQGPNNIISPSNKKSKGNSMKLQNAITVIIFAMTGITLGTMGGAIMGYLMEGAAIKGNFPTFFGLSPVLVAKFGVGAASGISAFFVPGLKMYYYIKKNSERFSPYIMPMDLEARAGLSGICGGIVGCLLIQEFEAMSGGIIGGVIGVIIGVTSGLYFLGLKHEVKVWEEIKKRKSGS